MCSLYVTYSYYLSSFNIYISTVPQHLQILATPLYRDLRTDILRKLETFQTLHWKHKFIITSQLASDAVDSVIHSDKWSCLIRKAYQKSDFGNLFRCLCNLFKITKHKTLPPVLDWYLVLICRIINLYYKNYVIGMPDYVML